MYHKILSENLNKTSTQKGEELILKIIGNSLPAAKISSIVKAYTERTLVDPDFNNADFFLDLKGYLYYNNIEKKRGPIKDNVDLKKSLVHHLFRKYNFLPATRFYKYYNAGEDLYFYKNTNTVIRIHSDHPADFMYKKLLGGSHADINRALGSNLFSVSARNIPGTPMECLERFLHIYKIEDYFDKHFRRNGREFIYDRSSLLLSDMYIYLQENLFKQPFFEINGGGYSNFGLVVRLDNLMTKKVYVVGYDLQLRNINNFEKSQQDLLVLKNQFYNYIPQSFDYEKMVNYLPILQVLVPQNID